jgi:hypothetical protein
MAFPAVIRRLVKAIANTPAGEMRGNVTHIPQIGRTPSGIVYGDPISRQAIVEFDAEGITLADGTVTASRAKLTFIEPVSVKDRDKFIIPDGAGGVMSVNTLSVKAVLDEKGIPYITEVWLGDLVGGGR